LTVLKFFAKFKDECVHIVNPSKLRGCVMNKLKIFSLLCLLGSLFQGANAFKVMLVNNYGEPVKFAFKRVGSEECSPLVVLNPKEVAVYKLKSAEKLYIFPKSQKVTSQERDKFAVRFAPRHQCAFARGQREDWVIFIKNFNTSLVKKIVKVHRKDRLEPFCSMIKNIKTIKEKNMKKIGAETDANKAVVLLDSWAEYVTRFNERFKLFFRKYTTTDLYVNLLKEIREEKERRERSQVAIDDGASAPSAAAEVSVDEVTLAVLKGEDR